MEFLYSVLGFLLVLTPVVFFHELGHFWAARRCGVGVEVFSVGFGSELFGYTDKRGTRWRFSALPLGGYVRMVGDDDVASTPAEGAARAPGSFHAAGLGARAFIVAMGPIANFILGIAIIAAIYIGVGKVVIPNVVGDVVEGGPAAEAGIEPSDRVVSVGGYGVSEFNDFRALVLENPGRPLAFVVEREGREVELEVTPAVIEDACLGFTYGQIGILSANGELTRYGPTQSVMLASVDSFKMAIAMLRGLARLASGNANKGEIGGPVKIAEISGRVATQGAISVAMFVAVISINLGLVNLLPVPALDGGHLMFFGLEKLMGRPLDPRVQGLVTRVGIALLLGLIVFLTFFDILGSVTRQC